MPEAVSVVAGTIYVYGILWPWWFLVKRHFPLDEGEGYDSASGEE